MSGTLLPHHWKIAKLGDIATLQRGRDLPQGQREQGPFPVIGSNGIVGYHSAFAAHGPGVLVGRSGSIGKVTWIEKDYWPLNTTLWVKDFHGNDPSFVYYLLIHLDLGRYTAGVSVPTLNRNTVHPLEIEIPPLPEQRSIAQALQAVQEAKEARQIEVALERERKAALMQHLFTHGTRGDPRKETEIGEIPETWQVVRLDSCLKISLRNGIYKPAQFIGKGDSRLVEITNLYNCERVLVVSDNFRSIEINNDEFERYLLKDKDVLINRVSKRSEGIVQARIVNFPHKQEYSTVFESNMFRARFNIDIIYPEFFSFYASSDFYLTQVMSRAQKANQTSINQPAISSVLIILPYLDEQYEIIEILGACETKIASLEQEAVLLGELFQSMLEKFMAGHLSAVPLIGHEANL